MGRHGSDRESRIAFLRDRRFVPGVGLSVFDGPVTRLSVAEMQARDWLKGSVASSYGLRGSPEQMARQAAVKDHVAQRAQVHPSSVVVDEDERAARCPALPLSRFPVRLQSDGAQVVVADAGTPLLDLTPIRVYARQRSGTAWPGEELLFALCERFVRQVRLAAPEAFAALRGRSALYLANHQVQVESVLFPMLISGLTGVHTVTIARAEHRAGWVGALDRFAHTFPGVSYPPAIIFFDQTDQPSMLRILEELRHELVEGGRSLLVHVEGALALAAGRPVTHMSSVFVDLAQALELPIVPVRFAGGLPVAELPAALDFPLGHARQDYLIGPPIAPAVLGALPYAERSRLVLGAINALAPEAETPNPDQPAFAGEVDGWRARLGVDEPRAVLLATLEELRERLPESRALLGEGGFSPDARGRWLAGLADYLRGAG
jgi:hypothetical protein